MNILQNPIRLISMLIILAIFIASCSTTTKPQSNSPSKTDTERQAQQWLDKARSSSSPEREQHLLAAAGLLRLQSQIDWALNILFSIDDTRLNNSDYLTFIQLYSNNAIATGQYFKAQDILTQTRLDDLWGTMSKDEQISLLGNRAHVNSLLGNYPKSLRERIALGALLNNNLQSTVNNNEAIWQDLMVLSAGELRSLQANVDSDELYGWYLLAILSKNNVSNLSLQLQQLESWQSSWPQHPANQYLPNDLQLLRQLIAQRPTKIALLLPQQGRLATAAAAVRDGFFASYYAGFNAHSTTTIQQYDTSQNSIIDVYNQAITGGAELIIGPLDKEHVTTLSQLDSLSVPILALNYKEIDPLSSGPLVQPSPPYTQDHNVPDNALAMQVPHTSTVTPLFTPKLYQFGLATEDEARQIARQAYREGHQRAMIIAPDRDWATRSVNAFSAQWQAQNGEIVARSTYISAQDYSKTIKMPYS